MIADEVWLDIVRGDIETAVFKSFRAVEVAVREAGHFAVTDIGTVLMRKAFDKTTGPLSNKEQPEAERITPMNAGALLLSSLAGAGEAVVGAFEVVVSASWWPGSPVPSLPWWSVTVVSVPWWEPLPSS